MRSSKDVSAQALAFLDDQRLPRSPRNYWLAFAFLDGNHRELQTDLAAIVDDGVRIVQAQADMLFEAFIGRSTIADGTGVKMSDEVRHQALRLADLATSASHATEEFSRELSQRLPDFAAPNAMSLPELVAEMIDRSRRAERELAMTSAEVDRLRQKLETVQGDAARDALTGLPNRRGIDTRLAAARDEAGPIVVAICDIDFFKSYNDRYGHGVGDRVLKTVAQSLRESLVGQFVGRWGGEEFLVVLRSDVATAVTLIDTAKTALGDRFFKLRETDEPMGRITYSAGVTLLEQDGDTAAAIERADALLYRAKQEGRDRVIAG